SGWVAERLKAPVLKVAGDCPGGSSRVSTSKQFQRIIGSTGEFPYGQYCLIPASWVQNWVQRRVIRSGDASGRCRQPAPRRRRPEPAWPRRESHRRTGGKSEGRL